MLISKKEYIYSKYGIYIRTNVINDDIKIYIYNIYKRIRIKEYKTF